MAWGNVACCICFTPGFDLPHGGHLSHGYQTDTKKISAVSVFYETYPYQLNKDTEQIDYEKMEENFKLFRPKMLVAGWFLCICKML